MNDTTVPAPMSRREKIARSWAQPMLDVGCGRAKTPGSIGVDHLEDPQVDVVADLEHYPWPFADDTFRTVVSYHVIEHLHNTIAFMEEIHRLAAPGADVHIWTPHFASTASWRDPTHVRHFSTETFAYFCGDPQHITFYTDKRFEVVSLRVTFGSGPLGWLGRLISGLSLPFYERNLVYFIRPRTIRAHLRVLKPAMADAKSESDSGGKS